MSDDPHPMFQLLRDDPRYPIEAYQFVREALGFAQEDLQMGDESESDEETEVEESAEAEERPERHVTGQQLCEAIRQYAIQQYGFMAKVVLNTWGMHSTSDFGEIVYNLIRIGWMKKSETDRREDFDGAYDFDEAFREQFKITMPKEGD